MSLPARLEVLLVEDDADHARLIARHLAGDPGFGLTRAASLGEAGGLLARGHFDILLTDLSLPDSPVEQTLGRALALAAGLPVVVLTAQPDLDFAAEAVKAGAQDFLVKSAINRDLLTRSLRYAAERKQAEDRLREYAAELERSNEELRRFAHTLAHEVRSPLGTIIYALEALKGPVAKSVPDVAEFLNLARHAAGNVNDLISELLDFASVGSRSVPDEPVETRDCLREAMEHLRPELERSGAEVDVGPLPSVPADRVQLRHLFQNLIANAVKYRGARRPSIRVEAEPDGGGWRFAVRDNGLGIPPECAGQIFEAFKRVNRPGDPRGTGIGLAFCKRVVENHGGRIWVESEPGRGSTFLFTLPARAAVPMAG